MGPGSLSFKLTPRLPCYQQLIDGLQESVLFAGSASGPLIKNAP